MIGIYLGLLCLVAVALGSESPYLGKIVLKPIETNSSATETVYFRTLTEEPKLINLKNNQIELDFVSEQETCNVFPANGNQASTLLVMDFSKLQRLSCGMVAKMRNIKNAGYKGFIMVMDDQRFLKNHCRMYDDNQFFTGVMDTGNFSKLDAYHQKGLKAQDKFRAKGVLSIELFGSQDRLLEIWVNSFSLQSYQVLRMFKNSLEKLTTLQKSMEWTPRFATLACTHGDNAETCSTSDYVASCGCKGEFCSPEIREKTPAPMVQQDIRQFLIFKQYSSKYLSYADLFADQCLETYRKEKYIEECATRVMDKLGIDSYSINSVVGSFLEGCGDDKQVKQSQIYSTFQRDQRAFATYGRYPLLLINKEIIQYKNEDLTGVLCTKLQLADEGCLPIAEQITTTESAVGVLFFVILILTLVAVGAAVVFCYRRRLKRDMNKQIKMQVSTAVEHYFALTESSSSAK